MKYTFSEYKAPEILRDHLNLGGANPSGEEIKVNSLYLERGGKPWMSVMGEYHFSRDDEDNWAAELSKMYAGGIRIVATYLFWIHHEKTEGSLSFAGNLNIRKFVETAKAAGLEVVLRVGPWAHGECRNGGLPDWILHKPYKVRSNDPEYLKEVTRWFKAIADEVKGLFFKDGGNIVAVQLENELTDDAEHLAKLKEIALETGLIAPLYTVTGWNSAFGAKIPVNEVLPVFGAYPDAPWAEGTGKLPLSNHYSFYKMRNDTAIGADIIGKNNDGWQLPYERYPFVTCEIGPGMMSTHHRRVVVSPMDAYAMSLVKLGCGNNLVGYYMYHGGTNPTGKTSMNESKATGYPNDYPVLNYDFGTCLSQYGEARGQYRYLNLLHLFIHDFCEILAPMSHVEASEFVKETEDKLRYCMRSDGKSGFIFVNNHQRLYKLSDRKDVEFEALGVNLPSMDIDSDVTAILPVNITLGEYTLEYATAQLLCRDGNTFFFTEIPGVAPRFRFKGSDEFEVVPGFYVKKHGSINIVVLEFKDALCLRKLDGKLYAGEDCDLYLGKDELTGKKVLSSIEPGDFRYREWSGAEFYEHDKEVDYNPPKWDIIECEAPFSVPEMFAWELDIESDTPRKQTWKEITTSSKEGFIEIDYKYDTAIIFADGKPVADKFYDGTPWRVPALLVADKKSYIVMSELKNDISIT
ncbi:MAG: beta-galactosidase [Lachnospiraceae bacterium]|nr:beta-galactosidase [Lachnospiraceae bacterium]